MNTQKTTYDFFPLIKGDAGKAGGFTLVELIVVITILAILGTIAFIALNGYSKDARDSGRITDLSSIKTGLELFQLDAGKYPLPTDWTDITYSGAVVWKQGTFGETSDTNVKIMDRIPTDPLTNSKYTYSVTAKRNEYEIAGIAEGGDIVMNKLGGLTQETYAGEVVATALVKGNYNGLVTKTLSGTNCDILSSPTIVASDIDTSTDVLQIINNQRLVYNGYNNLPSSFKTTKFKYNGGFNFTPNNIVSYSDTGSCDSLFSTTDNTARTTLITNLKTSYSGTVLANVDEIKNIINLDLNNTGAVDFLGSTIVNNSLGGTLFVSGGGGNSSSGGGSSGGGGTQGISGGASHSCAITNGGVKCWGLNTNGQLGDGTTINSAIPVQVSGLASGVSSITSGGGHTCAILTTGGVKCWGKNTNGELGDGTTIQSTTPVQVSGLTNGISSVSVGTSHSCAVTTSGGVQCWGLNTNGQLGNNSTIQSTTPVQVSGLTSGVSSVSVGTSHSCAILTTGGVKCWGLNSSGELGNNSTTQSNIPVQVNGLTSGVSSISVGSNHSCVVLTTGGVKCWGYNTYGGLGNNSTVNSTTPVQVTGLTSGVSSVSGGGYHTCAVLTTGGVKCWGYNAYGQLGEGTSTQSNIPVQVTGLATTVSSISLGYYHTCAVLSTGGVKCWGNRNYDINIPNYSDISISGYASVSGGGETMCMVTIAGGLKCWGRNNYGQIGDGTTTDRTSPQDVTGLTSGVSSVSVGEYHTCAVLTTGGVKCWGNNDFGALGNSSITTSFLLPQQVTGLTSGVSSIVTGTYGSCALLTTGGVKCWGAYPGNGASDGSSTISPVSPTGLTSGVSSISGGTFTYCAVLTTGELKCWGGSTYSNVGDGTNITRLSPVQVIATGVSSSSIGNYTTCALLTTGGVKCWGKNSSGEIGDSSTTNKSTPTQVTGLTSGVTSINVYYTSSCAILITGGLKCWGYNNFGGLGDGTIVNKNIPTQVYGLTSGVSSINSTHYGKCAILTTGGVKCWGFSHDFIDYSTKIDVSL